LCFCIPLISRFLAFGKGVLKDYKQAVYWYQKAADQGYAKAQSNLGIAYAFGKGVLLIIF
jgi:TPR repeat protein